MKSIPVHFLSSPFPDPILSIFLLSMETFSNQLFKSNNIKNKLSCLSFYYQTETEKSMFRRFSIFMLPCAKQTSDVCPFHIKEKHFRKNKIDSTVVKKLLGGIWQKGREIEIWKDEIFWCVRKCITMFSCWKIQKCVLKFNKNNKYFIFY